MSWPTFNNPHREQNPRRAGKETREDWHIQKQEQQTQLLKLDFKIKYFMTCHKCGLSFFLETIVKIRYSSDTPQFLPLWEMGLRNVDTKLAGKAGVGCNGRHPPPSVQKWRFSYIFWTVCGIGMKFYGAEGLWKWRLSNPNVFFWAP